VLSPEFFSAKSRSLPVLNKQLNAKRSNLSNPLDHFTRMGQKSICFQKYLRAVQVKMSSCWL